MRKISNQLIDRMTKGDLLPLLNYIKSDNELRLEVRNRDAFVYYRKGKALEIKSLKVDIKYGDVPNTKLAISNPSEYFALIKRTIDKWLDTKKKRAEFDTQQNIAKSNQNKDDRYLILDMEYQFPQKKIEKIKREKGSGFDLLGIDRETNKIVFFEVKKGMDATKGSSGIESHVNDFENFLFGKFSKDFRTSLVQDINNIIKDKTTLGILEKFDLSMDFEKHDPELVFVFHYNEISEIKAFEEILKKCPRFNPVRHKLIIVSDDNCRLK